MRATITLSDLPEHSGAKIGFSVHCQRVAGDVGITHAGSLAHQFKETLQHIAVEIEGLDVSAPADRLIDWHEVSWLTWSGLLYGHRGFPLPAAEKPMLWRRHEVMDWIRVNRPRRLDWDMAQAFIRRPAVKAGDHDA